MLTAAAGIALLLAVPARGQGIEQKPVVGYADRLSVRPGETIRFMVSSRFPQYRADLVRLIHGDTNPSGPGPKETQIESEFNRTFPGRSQDLHAGSYVRVEDHPVLRLSGSFTLQAWVAPPDSRQRAPGSRHQVLGRRPPRLRALHRQRREPDAADR